MYTTGIRTTLRKVNDPSTFGHRVVEAGWLLAIVLAPVYFGLYTSHQFDRDKILLLRCVVLVMLVADVLAAGDWRLGLRRWRERNPLLLPVLVYVGLYAIATATSISPSVSFFGFYERMQGLYTTLAYCALFVLFAAHVKTSEQIRRVVTTMLTTSVPVAIYGVAQRYGFDPIAWNVEIQSRVISTMGNPIFLGAYLLMIVPFTAARLMSALRASRDPTRGDEGSWGAPLCAWSAVVVVQNVLLAATLMLSARLAGVWWLAPGMCAAIVLLAAMAAPAPTSRRFARIEAVALSVLLVLQLTAIALTQSRGPFLGLLAACAAFGVAIVRAKGGRAFKATWMSLASALLLLVVLSSNGYLGRLGKFTEFSGSSEVRATIWRESVRLLHSRPPIGLQRDRLRSIRYVLGYGPETLQLALNPVYTARLQQLEGNAAPDRNHNELLDHLVMTGVAGLVAYVLVVFMALRLGWRLLGETKTFDDRLLVAATVGAIVGHVVETQTGIAVAATKTYFFLSLGLLVALRAHALEQSPAPLPAAVVAATKTSGRRSRGPKEVPAPAGPGRRTLLVVVSFIATGALLGALIEAGVIADLRAIVFLSFGWLVVGVLSSAAVGAPLAGETAMIRRSWATKGVVVVLAVAAIVANLNALAADVYYRQGARFENQRDFGPSIGAYTEATRLQPGEPLYFVSLGRSYLDSAMTPSQDGRAVASLLTASEAALARARELQPLDPNHYSNLGRLYRRWGERIDRQKLPLAERSFSDAIAIRPGVAQPHDELASLLFVQGRTDGAMEQARIAAKLDRLDVVSRILLGDLLLQRGDGDMAVEEYGEALALVPSALSDPTFPSRIDALVRLHKAEALVEPYRRAAKVKPATPAVVKSYAYLLDAVDRPGDAAEAYRDVLSMSPRDWLTARYLAAAEEKLGHVDQAIATLQQALRYAPPDQAQLLRQPLTRLLDGNQTPTAADQSIGKAAVRTSHSR